MYYRIWPPRLFLLLSAAFGLKSVRHSHVLGVSVVGFERQDGFLICQRGVWAALSKKYGYNPPNLWILTNFWGIITGLFNNSALAFSLRLCIKVSPFTRVSSSVANTLVDTQIYQFSSSGLRRKSINPIVTIPS